MTMLNAQEPALTLGNGRPWLTYLYWTMTLGYLFAAFVGLNPMSTASVEDRASGNPADRLFMMAFFCMAIPVLIHNRQAVLQCARANKLLLAVVAFTMLSTLWSSFPDITIRRAGVLIVTVVIAMAVIAGESNPRKIHSTLFFFLMGIIFFNFLLMVAAPGLAWSSDGFHGTYPTKNIAGEIGLMAIVVGVAWLRGTDSRGSILAGLVALAFTFIFLYLTKSKTSLGIGIIACGFGVLMMLGEWLGVRFILLIFGGVSLLFLGLIGFLFYHNFDPMSVISALFPDTSFSGRNAIWAFAYDRSVDRFWLGHGYGAFWDVGPDNDPIAKLEPGTWLGDTETGIINEAHNGYLDLWLNIGLPATVVLVLAYFVGMLRDFRIFNNVRSSRVVKSAGLAAGLTMLATLLSNFTESTLFFRGPPVFALVVMMRFLSARLDRPISVSPHVKTQSAS